MRSARYLAYSLLAACLGCSGSPAEAPPSSAKTITTFGFSSPAVSGLIDETGKTIHTTVPHGTIVTSLTPVITHAGASISPDSGVSQDFTAPVTYTVTAADRSTQAYAATVALAASSAKAIKAFYFVSPVATGTIDEATHTVRLEVYGDLTALIPAIAHTGASVSPPSGLAQDFSGPVTYIVTAADGSTQAYSVSVATPVRGSTLRVAGESLVLPAAIPAKLAFDQVVAGSITTRSTYKADAPGSIVYQEGSDYVVDYANGTIARTANSRIPNFSTNVLYGQKDFDHKKFPGYTNHPFFVWVDYETTNGEMFAKHNDQAQYLTASRAKLEAGGTFRIVSFGDSIAAGRETSAPNLRFSALYANYLQARFPNSTVLVEDVSIPSYTSTQGIASWDTSIGMTSPDLVLVGWGMNDHNIGGSTPEQFKQNLKTLAGMIKDLKHAEVILFSAFPPHNDWHYGTHRMNLYAEATRQAAAESSCAYVDVFSTWAMVLQRKDQSSLLGNNINHPNDFGHWLYGQAFEALNF